jgi:hypothetical protein
MARPKDPFGPIRDYWREINRQQRQADAQRRERQKAYDRKRPKCRCEAYPWPHRPAGGLCRYPDPPVERYQRRSTSRPYSKRYSGLLRQIARANGLHPIRDRAAIEALMPRVLAQAKQMHQQCPRKWKYRNMEITENGVTGYWTTAGPTM